MESGNFLEFWTREGNRLPLHQCREKKEKGYLFFVEYDLEEEGGKEVWSLTRRPFGEKIAITSYRQEGKERGRSRIMSVFFVPRKKEKERHKRPRLRCKKERARESGGLAANIGRKKKEVGGDANATAFPHVTGKERGWGGFWRRGGGKERIVVMQVPEKEGRGKETFRVLVRERKKGREGRLFSAAQEKKDDRAASLLGSSKGEGMKERKKDTALIQRRVKRKRAFPHALGLGKGE